MDNVTAVIVSLNTYELTRLAADSLVQAYPDIHLILVDNGSVDDSVRYLQACTSRPRTSCVFLSQNIGHGPALHLAAQKATTPYLFTMDSDCVVKARGFLEPMTSFFESPSIYAVGDKDYVRVSDGQGHARIPVEGDDYVPYIHPYAGLYRLDLYRAMRPFMHHGAPALYNMIDARDRGWLCWAFPIQCYIEHMVAGTRRMYPSARGNWNPEPEQQPVPWYAGDGSTL